MKIRRITIPARWYMGAHGDPVANFEDNITLVLMPDGGVRWESDASNLETDASTTTNAKGKTEKKA